MGPPELGWRGRNDGRNAAFEDLLCDSGLWLREGGCLLTLEVLQALTGHVYYEGTVAAAIAKRRERMFYVSASVLDAITAYMATTRRVAIKRAQRQGRYDRVPGRRVVTRISRGKDNRMVWEDRLGRRGEDPIRVIGERERRALFIEGSEGLEPLALWLTEDGMPMDYHSWEAVFPAANQRCVQKGNPRPASHGLSRSRRIPWVQRNRRLRGTNPGVDRHQNQVCVLGFMVNLWCRARGPT